MNFIQGININDMSVVLILLSTQIMQTDVFLS